MGKSHLELSQINYKLSKSHVKKPSFYLQPEEWLKPSLLDTKNVYILDCFSDVFLWEGRYSKKIFKKAGAKLAEELRLMLDRPNFSKVFIEQEGVESVSFRSFFYGWDTILKLDYTMAPDKSLQQVKSVSHVIEQADQDGKISKSSHAAVQTVSLGSSNIQKLNQQEKDKNTKPTSEITPLFTQRKPTVDHETALEKMTSIVDSIKRRHAFVCEGKGFIAIPKEEYGIFYDHTSYVYRGPDLFGSA